MSAKQPRGIFELVLRVFTKLNQDDVVYSVRFSLLHYLMHYRNQLQVSFVRISSLLEHGEGIYSVFKADICISKSEKTHISLVSNGISVVYFNTPSLRNNQIYAGAYNHSASLCISIPRLIFSGNRSISHLYHGKNNFM